MSNPIIEAALNLSSEAISFIRQRHYEVEKLFDLLPKPKRLTYFLEHGEIADLPNTANKGCCIFCEDESGTKGWAGPKRLFKQHIPQYQSFHIMKEQDICDECLEHLYESFQDREYFGEITFDSCASCKDDYLITPEERERREITLELNGHICDGCISGYGHNELGLSDMGAPYKKSTPCDSCRMPMETCLSKGQEHIYKAQEICESCQHELDAIDNELLGEWEMKNNNVIEKDKGKRNKDKIIEEIEGIEGMEGIEEIFPIIKTLPKEQTIGSFNNVEEFDKMDGVEFFMFKEFIVLNKENKIYAHIHDPGSYYDEDELRRKPFLSFSIVELKGNLVDTEITEENIYKFIFRYGEDHNYKFTYDNLGALYAVNSAFSEYTNINLNKEKQTEMKF